MNEIKCVNDVGRKYGLWSLDEEKNMAVRKCLCCGIIFYYPITKNILEEIKKQYEAIVLSKNFINLEISDPNLLGYVNVILSDVIDFIDTPRKNQLSMKLKEIVVSNYTSFENKIIIEKIIEAINSDNSDLYFDAFEEFKLSNKDNLTSFISSTKLKI